MNIEKYYNEEKGKEFKSRLNSLREKIGSTSFTPNKSTYGISGNTFRALTKYRTPPSKIYRLWAKTITNNLIINSIHPVITNQKEFNIWHAELFRSLKKQWNESQDRDLSFAHTYKLIDLYLKWLVTIKECPSKLVEMILEFGYCALDSQILLELNECLNGALPINKPSMGDIKNENTYNYCQELITDFVKKFGGTRLLFDFYAWQYGGKK